MAIYAHGTRVLHRAFTPTVDARTVQLSKAGQRYAWPVRRSVVVGMLAAGGLALVYSVVVAGASGSLNHLTDQVREDWYLLAPIISGFGVQIGLLAELRRRRSLVREAVMWVELY